MSAPNCCACSHYIFLKRGFAYRSKLLSRIVYFYVNYKISKFCNVIPETLNVDQMTAIFSRQRIWAGVLLHDTESSVIGLQFKRNITSSSCCPQVSENGRTSSKVSKEMQVLVTRKKKRNWQIVLKNAQGWSRRRHSWTNQKERHTLSAVRSMVSFAKALIEQVKL